MLYTKETPHYEPSKEVIKLTLYVNTEHYPNFPKEVFVSEFNLDRVISKLSGLDISIKRTLGLSDDEYNKTWITFGVKVEHTTNPTYFGVDGNTLDYRWI